ncbi:MAG: intradiol ring-cleavage dioxygenase [Roseiarcus sp.]
MAVQHFDADALTAAALRSVEGAKDPRAKEVLTSLIRHLHGFVREVRPTPEEWMAGIELMIETGRWSDDKRNEFILMSDTLGVSMLVDFLHYGKPEGCTESTVLGPFFVEGAPELPLGASIAKPGTPGEPCVVTGAVRDPQGRPIAGALLDVWEGDGEGFYDVQRPGGMNLRGRFRTGPDGKFWLKCVRPTSYPVPTDGPAGRLLKAAGRHPMRPGHLHTMLAAPGFATLVTHLFVRGDPYLDSDAVFGMKDSLIVDFDRTHSAEDAARFGMAAPFYRAHYDFVLKPAAGAAGGAPRLSAFSPS